MSNTKPHIQPTLAAAAATDFGAIVRATKLRQKTQWRAASDRSAPRGILIAINLVILLWSIVLYGNHGTLICWQSPIVKRCVACCADRAPWTCHAPVETDADAAAVDCHGVKALGPAVAASRRCPGAAGVRVRSGSGACGRALGWPAALFALPARTLAVPHRHRARCLGHGVSALRDRAAAVGDRCGDGRNAGLAIIHVGVEQHLWQNPIAECSRAALRRWFTDGPSVATVQPSAAALRPGNLPDPIHPAVDGRDERIVRSDIRRGDGGVPLAKLTAGEARS